MNYIFSFNTNDNNTFNLIYTSQDKIFKNKDKYCYIDSSYFIELINTVVDKEPN